MCQQNFKNNLPNKIIVNFEHLLLGQGSGVREKPAPSKGDDPADRIDFPELSGVTR